MVDGKSTGKTDVQAALGMISATTTITVGNPVLQTIVVTPVNPARAKGTKLSFTATGTNGTAPYTNFGTIQVLTGPASISYAQYNTVSNLTQAIYFVANGGGDECARCLGRHPRRDRRSRLGAQRQLTRRVALGSPAEAEVSALTSRTTRRPAWAYSVGGVSTQPAASTTARTSTNAGNRRRARRA